MFATMTAARPRQWSGATMAGLCALLAVGRARQAPHPEPPGNEVAGLVPNHRSDVHVVFIVGTRRAGGSGREVLAQTQHVPRPLRQSNQRLEAGSVPAVLNPGVRAVSSPQGGMSGLPQCDAVSDTGPLRPLEQVPPQNHGSLEARDPIADVGSPLLVRRWLRARSCSYELEGRLCSS